MKDGALISVIVPVYNVENYLDRCVKSILGQTYKNFELILVDDGSTDISGDMCDWYSILSSKIFVIHKENGGLSDARNAGTKMAKGEYVTYIDSDDYVSEDYLEYLLSLAQTHDADMVCGSYLETSDLNDNAFANRNAKENNELIFTGEEACLRMLEDNVSFSLVVACWKLIKTDIARKHPFPVGRLHEDNATTFKFFLDSSKVVISDRPIYAYYIREDSIQHREKSLKQRDDELSSVFTRAVYLEQKEKFHLAKPAWKRVFERLRDIVLENCSEKSRWKQYYNGLMCSTTKQFSVKMKAFLLMNCTFVFVLYRKMLSSR